MVSINELIQQYCKVSQLSEQLSDRPIGSSGQISGSASTPEQYYQCQRHIDIYDSPQLKNLATQAAKDRQLRILPFVFNPLDDPLANPPADKSPKQVPSTSSDPVSVRPSQLQTYVANGAIPVCLYEDDYPGWLALDDLEFLQPIDRPALVPTWTAAEIGDRLPQIITYLKTAMAQPNEYLWGGVIGPNYDCSGLMQAAFRSQGIWLPRDAYQQEAFIQPVELSDLAMGDLIFFGPKERANHVALYLGDRHYIHSSGKTMGRNGIGIDSVPDNLPHTLSINIFATSNSPPIKTTELADPISQAYAKIIHGAGRVIASYQPQGTPIKSIDSNVIPMI
ncbi:MAG: C40 family peptidase [Cyanobacteria bacterium P01_F01_bin.150]